MNEADRERMQLRVLADVSPQIEEWQAMLTSQASSAASRLSEKEAELLQGFQREHAEMVTSMQHGVGQLEAVMAGAALKEQHRIESRRAEQGGVHSEQAVFSKHMQLELPRLELRVDDVMSRLTGVEQLWVSKLDEMQSVVGQL